jgi:hypothetical protein
VYARDGRFAWQPGATFPVGCAEPAFKVGAPAICGYA